MDKPTNRPTNRYVVGFAVGPTGNYFHATDLIEKINPHWVPAWFDDVSPLSRNEYFPVEIGVFAPTPHEAYARAQNRLRTEFEVTAVPLSEVDLVSRTLDESHPPTRAEQPDECIRMRP